MSLRDYRFKLFASTAIGALREDPLQFSAQISRRFVPSRIRDGFAGVAERLPFASMRNAAGLLSDRPDLFETESAASVHASARMLWNQGDIDGALSQLPADHSLRTRLSDEWALLSKETRLRISTHSRIKATQTSDSGLDVLHVLTNSLPFTQSGYTVRSHRLLKAQHAAGLRLEALTRIGYPVTIGNLKVPDQSIVHGIAYRRILPASLARMPRERVAQYACAIAESAYRRPPSVLHTTTDYRNGLAVEAAAQTLGIPWVYEMRGQLEKSWVARQDPQHRSSAESSPRFHAWRRLETSLAARADAVVVLSDIQREELVARGIEADKIRILPNAFDWPNDVARISRTEARGLLGLPEADVWVGSVSALVDYEGFDTIFHAVRLLRKQGIDARAAVVGDGVSRPRLVALARELGISEYVIMPGRVSVTESHVWYQALDLFVVPRRDTPVCRVITPLKPLEALACSTPVFVSDLPALQLAPSHEAGLALAPDAPEEWERAIAATMPGSSGYIRMAKAAAALASTQSWKANAERSIVMYREIS